MDREAEITKRIELLKKKNELLMQRHKEIEADRRSAEKSGRSLSARQSSSEHQEREGNHEKFSNQNRRTRAHMDETRDVPEPTHHPIRQAPHSRGRGGGANPVRNTPPPRGRGRGGRRNQDYEAKRMENFRLLEEEMAQGPTVESEDNASFGVSRFLDDPRRKGDLDPEDRWKSTRHKGSYGGLEFDNIKREMRGRGRGGHYRDRGRGRGPSKLQMSAEMTGRERQDQQRWQAMREAADKEIMARSKNTEGRWRREWDAEKNDSFESNNRGQGHPDRYDERPRGYRGARARHGSGSEGGRRGGRRGARHHKEENEEERKENRKEQNQVFTDPPEIKDKPEEKDGVKKDDTHEPAGGSEQPNTNSKPKRHQKKQTQKERKTISPLHLAQQRAQTPSSKDGTEVWAQNSHHSDETGQEWINGANRSTEQWLPSDEGNREPAIDERMLEQQEDGATVYSRQLGRGWGDEKNIKATKAWVLDTEKAGATQSQPDGVTEKTRGRDEGRSFGKMHTARKDIKPKTETSRVKEEDHDRLSMRSASPRLKRDNPGLTVEIKKDGGRRVKRYSEGDSTHVQGEMSVVSPSDKKDKGKGSPVASPSSAGPLKTPEGLVYVEDWAEEMDMLSPTYASRHIQLEAGKGPTNNELLTGGETTDSQTEAVLSDSITKDLSSALEESKTSGSAKNTLADAKLNDSKVAEAILSGSVKKDLGSTLAEPIDTTEISAEKSCVKSNEAKKEVLPNKQDVPPIPSTDQHADDSEMSEAVQPVGGGVAQDRVDPQNVQNKNTATHATAISGAQTGDAGRVHADSQVEKSEETVSGDDDELDTSNKESVDGNFKDAEDGGEDDEFYECDDNGAGDQSDQRTESDLASGAATEASESCQPEASTVTEDSAPVVASEDEMPKEPPVMITSEDIQAVAEETVQPQIASQHDSSTREGDHPCDERQPKTEQNSEAEPDAVKAAEGT